MYQRAYTPIFIFNRLILTAILIMLYYHPLLQLLAITLIQIAMIGYMVKLRPFKSELMQVLAVCDEMILLFCILMLHVMYKYQYNNNSNQWISFVIIASIIISLLKNLIAILWINTTQMYSKLRQKIHKIFKVDKVIRRLKKLERKQQILLNHPQTNENKDEIIKIRDQVNSDTFRFSSRSTAIITVSSLDEKRPGKINTTSPEIDLQIKTELVRKLNDKYLTPESSKPNSRKRRRRKARRKVSFSLIQAKKKFSSQNLNQYNSDKNLDTILEVDELEAESPMMKRQKV